MHVSHEEICAPQCVHQHTCVACDKECLDVQHIPGIGLRNKPARMAHRPTPQDSGVAQWSLRRGAQRPFLWIYGLNVYHIHTRPAVNEGAQFVGYSKPAVRKLRPCAKTYTHTQTHTHTADFYAHVYIKGSQKRGKKWNYSDKSQLSSWFSRRLTLTYPKALRLDSWPIQAKVEMKRHCLQGLHPAIILEKNDGNFHSHFFDVRYQQIWLIERPRRATSRRKRTTRGQMRVMSDPNLCANECEMILSKFYTLLILKKPKTFSPRPFSHALLHPRKNYTIWIIRGTHPHISSRRTKGWRIQKKKKVRTVRRATWFNGKSYKFPHSPPIGKVTSQPYHVIVMTHHHLPRVGYLLW